MPPATAWSGCGAATGTAASASGGPAGGAVRRRPPLREPEPEPKPALPPFPPLPSAHAPSAPRMRSRRPVLRRGGGPGPGAFCDGGAGGAKARRRPPRPGRGVSPSSAPPFPPPLHPLPARRSQRKSNGGALVRRPRRGPAPADLPAPCRPQRMRASPQAPAGA